MACFGGRGVGGGGGGGEGDKNVVHILLPCTTLWYLPRFRLFVQHTAQVCGTRHVVTCQFRRCPKHWYLPRFCLVVRHTAQQCGAGHVVTSAHANCDDAQNTGIFHVFASLYNTLRKDVEEEKPSQVSMPLAEVRSHLTQKPPIQ